MLLKNATLEDCIAKLNEDALMRLHHPPNEHIRIVSPGTRQSIAMYLALEHASQDAYNHICRATARNFAGAESVDEILGFYSVEKLIAQYTGVIPLCMTCVRIHVLHSLVLLQMKMAVLRAERLAGIRPSYMQATGGIRLLPRLSP